MTAPTAVFPSFAGLEFPVVKTPVFSTLVQQSVSGMETRAAMQLYPRWKYTLSFNFLRDLDSPFDEFSRLAGFFLARKGPFEAFLFNDPDDNVVVNQQIGTGDGSNRNFQLIRTLGGFDEPILCPVFVTIIVAGVALARSAWSYTSQPGQVRLDTAPASGAAVTTDLTYCWPVRFLADETDFSKFLDKVWEAKQIEFISVKNF